MKHNAVAPEPVLWDRKLGINTREYGYKDWLRKISEEIAEAKQALDDGERLAAIEELVDVITVVNSFAYQLGAHRDLINMLQVKINEKNARRGALKEH